MIITRRRVLSGLIAAPAVLVLGAHMPVRSLRLLRYDVAGLQWWLQEEISRAIEELLSLPHTPAIVDTIAGVGYVVTYAGYSTLAPGRGTIHPPGQREREGATTT